MVPCHYHPDRSAVAGCRGCGYLVCRQCLRPYHAGPLCNTCADDIGIGRAAHPPPGDDRSHQAPEVFHSPLVSPPQPSPTATTSPVDRDEPAQNAPPHLRHLRERHEAALQGTSLGGTLTLQGAILLLVSVPVLMAGSLAGTLAFGTAGLISIAAGTHYLVASRKAQDEVARAEMELRLIRAAEANGGTLSATQAAVATQLTVHQAQELLDQLALAGHVDIGNDERDGTIVYTFATGALAAFISQDTPTDERTLPRLQV